MEENVGILRLHIRTGDRVKPSAPWWKPQRHRTLARQLVKWASDSHLAMAAIIPSNYGFLGIGRLVDTVTSEIPDPQGVVIVEIAGTKQQLADFVMKYGPELQNAYIQLIEAKVWRIDS